MFISTKVAAELAKVMCGDTEISPYLKGHQIVDIFNELGLDLEYANFGTRWMEMRDNIILCFELNKYNDLFSEYYILVKLDSEYNEDLIFKRLNFILSISDLELTIRGNRVFLSSTSNTTLIIDNKNLDKLSTEFLESQIRKCVEKIKLEDFNGAITNARSMVEEVLLEVEFRITGIRGNNDGMKKVYNRVKKILNLSPDNPKLNNTVKQILSGMESIVSGIASMRNRASDSHATVYKASKHHAELCFNSAMTFTSFVVSSYYYQLEKQVLEAQ